MTTTIAKTKPAATTPTLDALRQLLADSYALMADTQQAHWNVEGPQFFALHAAFQGHYEELFAAVDELAERLRALGAYSPGGLHQFVKLTKLPSFDGGPRPAAEFVSHLVAAHEIVAGDAAILRDTAGDAGDFETQDLAIGRIQSHRKTLWMLKSALK